jgi:lipoprotein-anchoring transpeptidase ErfK/SrfK
VPLVAARAGSVASATISYKSPRPGTMEIRATRAATADQVELNAEPVRISVLPQQAKPGAVGPTVRLLQSQLARLGYVVGKRGFYDARTARAVLAFRKVTGMARTDTASSSVFRALARGAGRFVVRHGKHIEADVTRQVLALISHGKVERIYPISSGKPSTPSPIGSFRVYEKRPGTSSNGMVFSSFFLRGFAVHGYAEVPVFAASHGCLRVPIPEALSIYSWLATGDVVDVYR